MQGSLYSVRKNQGAAAIERWGGEGAASREGKAFVWQFSPKELYFIPFHHAETQKLSGEHHCHGNRERNKQCTHCIKLSIKAVYFSYHYFNRWGRQ